MLSNERLLLIYRVVVTRMSEFSDQAEGVNWHITCKYPNEMATKSTVVCTRWQLHEWKLQDLVDFVIVCLIRCLWEYCC